MKIRIDYLNKYREVKHTFVDLLELWHNYDMLWFEVASILIQWWTDIRIYNTTNPK